MTHSGRGGAGNIRSPSRNRSDIIAEEKEANLQDRLVAEARGRQADQPFSTGRGGVGNIRDKSRSRSAVRGATPSGASDGRSTPLSQGHVHHDVHSSGRGGWGNISEDRERDSVDEAKVSRAARNELRALKSDLSTHQISTIPRVGIASIGTCADENRTPLRGSTKLASLPSITPTRPTFREWPDHPTHRMFFVLDHHRYSLPALPLARFHPRVFGADLPATPSARAARATLARSPRLSISPSSRSRSRMHSPKCTPMIAATGSAVVGGE